MIKKIFNWINANGFMLHYTYLGGAALYGLISGNFLLILFALAFGLGAYMNELQCKRAELYKKYSEAYHALSLELTQELITFCDEQHVVEIIKKHLPNKK